MSNSAICNQNAAEIIASEKAANKVVPKKIVAGQSNGINPQFSYFAIIFYLLLSSMTIRQNTVITQSKEISTNASIQNRLNKQNADIKFSILKPGAKTATINRVQDENEQYAALRENIQNSLITARQNAQVMMTQASTNVNVLQQDASENSGWLKTLNTIFQVIVQMTQNL